MEIIFLIVGFLVGAFFFSSKFEYSSKSTYVNPYPSEAEITELDIIKQKSEDEKVYRNYHSQRTQEMYEAHTEDFFKTIKDIDEFHLSLQRPKEADFEDLDRRYKQYEYECKKLKVSPHILTYEQFAIQQSNWVFCRTIRIHNPMPIMYNIYDMDTAKYKNGNVSENLEFEFQAKFYADLN